MAEQKSSDFHDQPFPGQRPTVEPNDTFDAGVAKQQAEKLRKAMKGLGTNEKAIIEVTSEYSHAQRMQIKAAFNAEYKRDLIKDLKSELGGNLEDLTVGFWLDVGLYDAQLVDDAVEGLGFSTKLLNEVICTRTNAQLQEMQAAWSKGMSMMDRIKKETTKGSGSYCSLLVTLLEGKRPANSLPDADAAKADAELLNRYLLQEKESAAKERFVEIFTLRSWVQLREISGIFQDISKKYTLKGAIEKAFGDGDTSKALQTIDAFACAPYDFFAQKLKESMKGMGTDDKLLQRVIVSRAEIDLRDISTVFGQRYGDGKTLANWIKSDTKGDYEKLLLAICQLE
mmetsp:Transcript_56359/g.93840  ORF Transcript_56359/g.93840 Transcript_56359/m.93840 type:complete len:341 (+) Transcript_56359:69-1091(+)|eukprot:CAMPEP_0202687626 /NCGR_PEP_ID=MMETSP1385-20130828/3284_1 /ASSEMBLY_ACC=CAM_ASM_000861 /TAXON_ID=933848 /ORGANISM="Elphidium margaritaceum" /LENGTH=340 /DNA_ID=CAMNT_0049342453 /DNA_START=27 /DNA_END=1049 /DNA_ORIENTATION=+